MTKFSLLILFLLTSNFGFGQSSFYQFFDPTTFLRVNSQDHLEPKFKWTVTGKTQAFMNEGLNELMDNHVDQAVKNFTEVINSDSSFWPAYYYRGISYKKNLENDLALKDLVRASELEKNSPEVFIELGEAFHIVSKFSKAKNCYERAHELNPKLPGEYMLGLLAVHRGQKGLANRYFESSIKRNPKFPNSYYALGILRYEENRKDPSKNLTYFTRAIEADSSFKPALFLRGLVFAEQEKNKEAISDWNQFITYDPFNPAVFIMRGVLKTEISDFDGAFSDFKKAFEIVDNIQSHPLNSNRNIVKLHTDLSDLANYLNQKGYGLDEKVFQLLKASFCKIVIGKYEEAAKSMLDAISIQPSAAVFLVLAVAYDLQNKVDEAILNYNKALALDNDIYDAHKRRALRRFSQNFWTGTNDDLAEMRRLQPNSETTYKVSGMIQTQMKHHKEAIDDFTNFIKLDSGEIDVWILRATNKVAIKDHKEAQKDFKMASLVEPDNQGIYRLWFNQALLASDTTEALNAMRTAGAIWVDDPDVQLELVNAYTLSKRYDSAYAIIKKFQKKLYMYNVNFEAQLLFNLAKVQVAQKEYQKGLNTINKCINDFYTTTNERLEFRARLLLKLGQVQLAIPDIQRLYAGGYAPAKDLYKNFLNKDLPKN